MKLLAKIDTLQKKKKRKEMKFSFKGQFWGLQKFLATETLFKMVNNAFYFVLKALLVLKILKFLFCLF